MDVDEPRTHARQVLKTRGATSAWKALAFVGGAGVIAATIAGSYIEAGEFPKYHFISLALFAIALWPVAFAILEIIRLHEFKDALQGIMNSVRTLELLLIDARRERDEARNERLQVQAQLALVMAARTLPTRPPSEEDSGNG